MNIAEVHVRILYSSFVFLSVPYENYTQVCILLYSLYMYAYLVV